jgi:choline kinase
MQVDCALILSAGLGTRMGEIGKVIPKVMWPIGQKKLIDLQIDYCRDLGINKIFINVHYLSKVIEDHIVKNYGKEIIILNEDPLLDSGGAIHNLAKHPLVNFKGNVLLVNGDQFLIFEKGYYNQALSILDDARAVLFGIKVGKNENYNEVKVEKSKMVEIAKNQKTHDYITYSGLGILKLDGLIHVDGISKFFETVANYKTENIKMITPEVFEYWDFGTAPIYFENIFKALGLDETNSSFINFLKKHSVNLKSESLFINQELLSVDLDRKGRFAKSSLLKNEIVQKI